MTYHVTHCPICHLFLDLYTFLQNFKSVTSSMFYIFSIYIHIYTHTESERYFLQFSTPLVEYY